MRHLIRTSQDRARPYYVRNAGAPWSQGDMDTLRTLALAPYGVRLSATRDSIAFGPHGLGWGAATTTITLERGTARTALAVSRLGRVRRL